MTDIRIIEGINLEMMMMDWLLLPNGTLDTSQELATAVSVALGTNGLAADGEVLPDPDSTDRQGWWGDYQAEEIWGGWPIGSRLWLLKRAKITDAPSSEGSTLQRARNYVVEALQPFVERNICTSFRVLAIRPDIDRIYVAVMMYRGPKDAIELRFQMLWDEI